jgi:hypothetical protein
MNKALENCLTHHFADDTNLLYAHKDPKTLKNVVNKDLARLFQWLCANRLSLNVAKTEFLIFKPPRRPLPERIVLSLNNKKIFESFKMKYLGLILDSRLTFRAHINELSKKLSQSIGMLYKIRNLSSPPILLSLYHAIFSSHLIYGLPVWGNTIDKNFERIELLQKKAIRAITNADYNAHTSPIFKDLGILKLKDQFDQQMASLLWDLDHDTLPPSLSAYFTKVNETHSHATRLATANKYTINKTNTLYGKKSFKNQGSIALNALKDTDIYKTAQNKKIFLKKLKASIIQTY